MSDSSSRSASVAGSITTFSLIVPFPYSKISGRGNPRNARLVLSAREGSRYDYYSGRSPERQRSRARLTLPCLSLVSSLQNRAEAIRRPYEADIPTKQAHAQTPARVSRAHEDERRPRHARPSPPARPQTFASTRCRTPLRAPHGGVSPEPDWQLQAIRHCFCADRKLEFKIIFTAGGRLVRAADEYRRIAGLASFTQTTAHNCRPRIAVVVFG